VSVDHSEPLHRNRILYVCQETTSERRAGQGKDCVIAFSAIAVNPLFQIAMTQAPEPGANASHTRPTQFGPIPLRRLNAFLAAREQDQQQKTPPMKFMITWQFRPGKLHDGLSQFSQMKAEQDQADHGSAVKLIGRWHDLPRGRGVVICESASAEAVSNWALNWNSILDVDVAVVLDDDETRALGKKRTKQQ
jgi:hypothetical protein